MEVLEQRKHEAILFTFKQVCFSCTYVMCGCGVGFWASGNAHSCSIVITSGTIWNCIARVYGRYGTREVWNERYGKAPFQMEPFQM